MKTALPSAKEVSDWLSQGMGPERLWLPEVLQPKSLAVSLAAMANTNGGVVIVGISPSSSATDSNAIGGVRNPSETVDRVFQAVLACDPPLVLPVPKVITHHQAQLVVVTVPPGLPHVYSVDGRYFGRVGEHNVPLSPRQLRQLMVERNVVQFESQVPPGASLQDLDLDQVQAYLQVLGASQTLQPGILGAPLGGAAWEQVLLRRGCLRKVNGKLAPTYAGILLFGQAPQQWLPSAMILAARFSGKSMSGHFIKQEIYGTLPVQLSQAEAFLRLNMRSVVQISGLVHEERYEYPLEAVRELLVNAVAHRDYNAQGDTIHLHLFTDRLEVHSPGELPGPVNLQNLLEARFARNAVITQILADLGFVERLGYGLDRVVAAMQERGLPPPRFEEVAHSFRVTLYNDLDSWNSEAQFSSGGFSHLDLNPRQKKALGYLIRQRRITNRDYQGLCPDVHMETLRRDLAELVSMGLLIKVGDKRATYYILKRNPEWKEK